MTNYIYNSSNSVFTTTDGANAGHITGADNLVVLAGGYLMSMGGGSATGLYVDGYADGSEVDVEGIIRGTSSGIYNLGDNTTTNVFGHVYGKYTGIGIGNDNNKVFISADGVVSGDEAMSIGGQYNTVFNQGTLTGVGNDAIQLAGTSNHIINEGTISGNFDAFFLDGFNAHVENSGYIHGGVYVFYDESESGNFTVDNSGVWDGDINFTATGDTLRNTGEVTGSISMGKGGDQFTNSGTIEGYVLMGDDIDLLDSRHGVINGAVLGGLGSDTLLGGGSADVFYGNEDNDQIRTGGGDDEAHGDVGNDRLNTGDGDDLLTGDDGADQLKAGRGDDTLNGGLNSDILVGGAGDDLMTGGKQGDTFQFRGDFGHDLITDFEATGNNHDTLSFSHHQFTGYADLQAHMAQVGSDVVIHAGDSDVVLQNVTLANLVAADFTFVS